VARFDFGTFRMIRGIYNVRIADYSGVDAIFVNTRAFTVLIQSRLHRCW